MEWRGGGVVRHYYLEVEDEAILRPDGLNLKAIGLDFWTLGLIDGIK